MKALLGLDGDWLESLESSLPAYLARLASPEQPGRFLPCERGATPVGRAMSLGFSCLALKVQITLGGWDKLPAAQREAWLNYIRSFQQPGSEGAFVDPPQVEYLTNGGRTWRERLGALFARARPADFTQSIVLAETKQALATLAEADAAPTAPFRGFPMTAEGVREFFQARDWSRPWGAGGQCAGLVVFLCTQGPALLGPAEAESLQAVCRAEYAALADADSGAYFRGRRPPHGELINGAMKVLMGLDWLGEPPHYPQRLIQTCLAHPPSPDGCHLVDAVYVLHQCSLGEATAAIRAYCGHVLALIRRHAQEDGGFSFYAQRAQDRYYGVPISAGLPESDIHGTCLLTWALALVWRLLAPDSARWKPLRP